MTDSAPSPQPALANVPEDPPFGAGSSPFAYISAVDATALLASRWGLTAQLTEGLVLAASMALDEEGPWLGVKVDPQQERQFPRQFDIGWPNIILEPSPVMAALAYPGAWALNYDSVIPQQIVDYTILEAWRYTQEEMLTRVMQESVTGASVKYSIWDGRPGSVMAVLDKMQAALISPFQIRIAHRLAFPYFKQL